MDEDSTSQEHLMENDIMTESNFDSGMIAGMLSNHGVDPGILALMNDCRNDGNWGGNNGGFLVLILLLILFGGRNGFGNWGADGGVAGVDRTVVNEANYAQMMDAIRGNRGAIERLADTLNCDVSQLQMALCGVDKQLAVNHGDIINAVQSCCCNVKTEIMQAQNALQAQMARCCCDTNLNIERQANDLRSQIQETRFQIQTTDAATRQHFDEKFNALSLQVERGFCDQRERELMNRIHDLEDQRDTLRTEAQTAVLLNAANSTKCFNGRYDTTTSTICGSVGARNCCCNRIQSTTPAATADTEAEAAVAVKTSKKSS